MNDEENVIHLEPVADREGSSKSRIANALELRREIAGNALSKKLVQYDEFAQRIMLARPIPRPGLRQPKEFEPRPWVDSDDTALTEHLNARGFLRCGRTLVRDVVELEARSHPYHPVRDYLDGLVWDGTERLSQFLIEYCEAQCDGDETKLYVQQVTRCLFLSAVARIMQPGCKVDHMPILEGAQGTLKSSLLRTLAVRDEWFSDSLPHDLGSRDARQHLTGVWIVEMSEITQFRRSEVEAVKDFLSCQRDRYRPPYGRAEITVPRQAIFIGTTNSELYLHDPSGNRRFWPVRIANIQLDAIRPIVGQLWAEAVEA